METSQKSNFRLFGSPLPSDHTQRGRHKKKKLASDLQPFDYGYIDRGNDV